MAKSYTCKCCGIVFLSFSSGMDIRIDGTNIIIIESEISGGIKWRDYIPFIANLKYGWYSHDDIIIKTFGQFIDYIKSKLDTHIIYKHLYNRYNKYYDEFKEHELSWEYIY